MIFVPIRQNWRIENRSSMYREFPGLPARNTARFLWAQFRSRLERLRLVRSASSRPFASVTLACFLQWLPGWSLYKTRSCLCPIVLRDSGRSRPYVAIHYARSYVGYVGSAGQRSRGSGRSRNEYPGAV